MEKQTTYFIKWYTDIKNLLSCQFITASKWKNRLKQYLSFRFNHIQDASYVIYFFSKGLQPCVFDLTFFEKVCDQAFFKEAWEKYVDPIE